ncbi:MAG: PD40 domain-containing protein [Anaerolineae bacterium]|nr:PD40 domain-containing protein [Anaerolineae bacterium]
MFANHFRRFLVLFVMVGLLTAVSVLTARATPPRQEDRPSRTAIEDIPHYPLAETPEAGLALESVTVVPASKVAFQSYRSGNWDIFVGNDDGAGQTAVTSHIRADIHPHLNRGSTAVVYASRSDDHDYEIYRVQVNGSNRVALTNNEADDGNPQWSPDGTRILFESYRDGQGEIYVMNADGSGQTRLTTNGAFDGMPSWSPDGAKIAFSSNRSGAYRIWVMNADGSNPVQLSNQPYSFRPQWSPDGSKIAYDADGNNDGWQELWWMNADGSNQQAELTATNNTDLWVGSWSPDGRYIAITRIHFVYYQGNWYWDYAYQEGRDINLYNYDNTTFPLSQSDVDWHPRWQTSDGQPPVSQVHAMGTQSPSPISVSWSGTDTGGSGGISTYDVQVKVGANGSWTDWQIGTTSTSAPYPGVGGTTYYFRARAHDRHYNIEPWPASHDAATTIEALPPQSYIHTLPAYSRQYDKPLITWAGFDPGGSGISSYDVQYRVNSGPWINWLTDTLATSANFNNSTASGSSGDTVFFRIRASDRAQNEANWPSPGNEASMMLYAWGVAGTAYDNTDTPVAGVSVTTNPPANVMETDDRNGRYQVYMLGTGVSNYAANWHKNGYIPLAETGFIGDVDQDFNVWFAPADNAVANWDFEAGSPQVDWLLGGSMLPVVTDTVKHTGEYSLKLGQHSHNFSPTQVVGNGYSPQISVDAEGVVHVIWGEANLYYRYRAANGSWSQTQQIASDHYPPQELLVDEHGNLHGIGGTADQGIYYVYRNKATGLWSVTSVVNDGNWSMHPDLAVDSSGRAHIVWESRYPGSSNTSVKYSYRLANGAFSTPIAFQDTYGYSREPLIEIDGNDNLHIIWLSVVDYDRIKIMYVTSAQGNWLQTQVVTPTPRDIGYHTLAIEEDSTAHIVWSENTNFTPTIYYRYVNEFGMWSDVQSVVQSGWIGAMQTAVDSKGTVHVVWTAEGVIKYIRIGHDTVWAHIYPLADTNAHPQIALDGAERAHVYWGGGPYFDSPNSDIYHVPQLNSYTWLTPVNLSPGGSDPSTPRAVIDTSGAVHMVWTELVSNEPYILEIRYRGPESGNSNEDATATQQISIPVTMAAPTLSFVYQLGNFFPQRASGFSVVVDDGSTQSTLVTLRESSLDWDHYWADMTPWVGQTISVSFTLEQAAGEPLAWAYLDEVSVGSTYPDSDVHVGEGNAAPGQEVVQTIAYSNRGGAAASGITITYTLPAGMTYLSASIPPASTNPLVWHLPDLPAKSAPFEILVTARVNANTPAFTTLTSTAVISTTDPELELLNNQAEGHIYTATFRYLPVILR